MTPEARSVLKRFLSPDDLGLAIDNQARDLIRVALGQRPVDTKLVYSFSEPTPPDSSADAVKDAILDQPAQVSGGVFGKGIKHSIVVQAAQRNYQWRNDKDRPKPYPDRWNAAEITTLNAFIKQHDRQFVDLRDYEALQRQLSAQQEATQPAAIRSAGQSDGKAVVSALWELVELSREWEERYNDVGTAYKDLYHYKRNVEAHIRYMLDRIIQSPTAAEARREALEDAAKAIEAHDKKGREWVPGSLWDTLSKEAGARIRALQSTPAAQEGGAA